MNTNSITVAASRCARASDAPTIHRQGASAPWGVPSMRVKQFLVPLLLALTLSLGAATAYAQATLTSDQPDYEPGSIATLTGAGFAPGETVTLQVHHADGTADSGTDHEPWTVVADASGGFVTTWHVCMDDCLGSELRATAMGMTSERNAAALFTDNVLLLSVNSVSPSVITSLPATITVNFTYSTGPGGTTTGLIGFRQPGAAPFSFFPPLTTLPNGTGLTATISTTIPLGVDPCSFSTAEVIVRVSNGAAPPPPRLTSPPLPIDIQLDQQAPIIDCPAPISLTTNTGCTYMGAIPPPPVTDDCPATVITNDAPGSLPLGATMVTWTARDPSGNTSTCAQMVTVVDDDAPTLTMPGDLALTTGPGIEPCAEARLLVSSVGSAAAGDNCGTPEINQAGVPAGGFFPVGATMITYTATDAAGNTTTGTQTVTVSCPVGVIAGTATSTCNGVTKSADGVVARLLHEGTPFRETVTGGGGGFEFGDVRLGTYTVQIIPPPDLAVPVDTRLVTLVEENATVDAESFAFTCLLSDLTGQVLGTCNGQTPGLQGVTVDVFGEDAEGLDVLIATTGTDALGNYRFDDLALGEYTVGIVLPLGYSTGTASQTVTLATADGSLAAGTFSLTCQVIAAQPRSMGFWKHQVNVYLTGKGSAQETLADLLHYVDELVVHFNQNLINPVIVYVPGSANTNDKLLQLQQLLTVNRSGTMLDRAKQQLLALLLNVGSGKISQTEVISDNGATVSQAITHGHDLIIDGLTSNDETAKTLCELINNGQRAPSGMVPASTRVITYDQRPAPREQNPVALRLGPIAPNPATLGASITFALPHDAPASLEVVDLAGRMVSRLDVGSRGAGVHTFRLAELKNLRPGVYLIRLSQGRESLIKRLAVIR